MKKATHEQTKNHNARLVLKTIYEQGTISRADIARATRLTRPTVSSIVNELLEAAFVLEDGLGPSAGGKPPTLLTVDGDAHHLICTDLGSQEFRGALVNLRGEIQQQVSLPVNGRTGTAAFNLVTELIDALLAQTTTPILGIGLGTPGLIDPQQGIIQHAVNLGWANLPIRDLLAAQYQKPIYVANDSHMAALAEYTYGQDHETSNLILIKIGQGIGAGIVLNGHSYYGDGFGAGEVGHVVVVEPNQGVACRCGLRGCLETVASTRAIWHQAEALAPGNPHYTAGLTWEAIGDALTAGDAATTALITEVGHYLGLTIANLVGSLNIHNLVLAGRIDLFGDTLLSAITHTVQQRVLPAMAADTTVHFSTLGRDIVLLGSAAMVLKHELGIV
ncbi:MAG: ROK family transcriptional regulator [Chloroflexota bacterium]